MKDDEPEEPETDPTNGEPKIRDFEQTELVVLEQVMRVIDTALTDISMPTAVRISLLGSLLISTIHEMSDEHHPTATVTAKAHAEFLLEVAKTSSHEELSTLLRERSLLVTARSAPGMQ